MPYRLLLAALVAACLLSPAEARHIPAAERSCIPTSDVMRPCAYQPNFLAGVREIRVTMHRVKQARNPRPRLARETTSSEVVAHPSGCPRSAFCGCGAAVHVFGHSVRDLWLAANWFKFPRTAPAPGMAAVRRHHVMILEADLGGGIWSVYDANSGHHMTRVHARSISGYQIVNPHGIIQFRPTSRPQHGHS